MILNSYVTIYSSFINNYKLFVNYIQNGSDLNKKLADSKQTGIY